MIRLEKEEEQTDWSKGMLSENPDYAGWLKVYGTKIDYPVVLGETNDSYLRKDFYGKYSIGGTLFFDETTDFSKQGNRIIYGHKMKDDTMFGSLDNFKSKDFFNDNGYVEIEDINGTHYYKVFAVMVVPGSSDADQFIDFQKWNNKLSDSETETMLKKIEEQAYIFKGPFITEDSTFLFLITCDYSQTNGRLCLVAKSISTEEKITETEK